MRIVTRFKDYYDGLSAYDREPTPVYVRHTEEKLYSRYGYNYNIPDSLLPLTQHCRQDQLNVKNFGYRNDSFVVFDTAAIFFCGKVYRFVITMGGDCFYSIESLNDDIKNTMGDSVDVSKYFRNHFDIIDSSLDFDEPIVLAAPVSGHGVVITKNPKLDHFGFAKIINPYEAYREIGTYLSNRISKSKPTPPISDEAMAEIKGFDKHSFRKKKK